MSNTASSLSAPLRVLLWPYIGSEHRIAELLAPTCEELGLQLQVLSPACGLLFPQFNPEVAAAAASKLSAAERQAACDELRQACSLADVWLGWPQSSWARVLELIGGWPARLRWIQAMGAGVDEVLVAVPASVLVTRAEGKFDASIAEWVLTWIFMHAKAAPAFLASQRSRTWQRRVRGVSQVAGSSALIVGYGSIGRRVAQLCAAVGVRVAATRRSAAGRAQEGPALVCPAAELHALLPEADFVVLCTPLTPATRASFGRRELAAMRRGAALINIARGEIVDWDAVRQALVAGELAAYYTDVTSPEPLPDGHADWDVPNFVVTPHNSWAPHPDPSDDADRFADNVRRFLAGQELRSLVDREAGY